MNGCNGRSCRCGMWINCDWYIGWKYKIEHNDEFLEEIHKWYIVSFRLKDEAPDAFANG